MTIEIFLSDVQLRRSQVRPMIVYSRDSIPLMVGPALDASNLLRQTYGERFVVQIEVYNFANEFRAGKDYLHGRTHVFVAAFLRRAIIYLHTRELFAFAIQRNFCLSVIEVLI